MIFENLFTRKKPKGIEQLRELCGVHWGSTYKGEMHNDHGERTNKKLNDQPFYHRGKKGKMRNY